MSHARDAATREQRGGGVGVDVGVGRVVGRGELRALAAPRAAAADLGRYDPRAPTHLFVVRGDGRAARTLISAFRFQATRACDAACAGGDDDGGVGGGSEPREPLRAVLVA